MPDPIGEAWTLSTIRPTRRAEKLAFGMIFLSFLTCAVVGPIARTPLPKLDAFIPAYEAALGICDLLTAALLYAEFSRERNVALLIVAGSYLYNLLLIIPHALTFPGVFAPQGL